MAKYVASLHSEDLGLAVACAAGHEAAWEHFITSYRPVLYRAARALTKDEAAARELADTLWAELYGVGRTRASLNTGSRRRSLLEYFHGRSKLSTWLRSVLAQRHVDQLREHQRLDPLGDEDGGDPPSTSARASADVVASTDVPDPSRGRYARVFEQVLGAALDTLDPRDRLRLSCYYAQELTLAETGRVLGEHEATVSRRLARARKRIREHVELALKRDHDLSQDEIKLCYQYALEVPTIDLGRVLGAEADERPAAPKQDSGLRSF